MRNQEKITPMETMTDLRKETIDGVKKLIRMNHDASEGYADAADRISCDGCEGIFRNAGTERDRFANELMLALQITDEDIPEGGTALGLFHRCWLNIRGALTGGDGENVISEAIRGESALIDEYEDVLKDTTGSPLNATLHRHIASVREVRESLESLKKQFE
jgi:uncharacterized protein (TIGR02284 family)